MDRWSVDVSEYGVVAGVGGDDCPDDARRDDDGLDSSLQKEVSPARSILPESSSSLSRFRPKMAAE